MPYQTDEADAHRDQDPKQCGNHGDGHLGQKLKPGLVAVVFVVGWALKKVFVVSISQISWHGFFKLPLPLDGTDNVLSSLKLADMVFF